MIRQARPADLPEVVAAADAIFRSPSKPGLSSMGRDYPLLFSPANAGNLYVAEIPGGADIQPDAGATATIVGHTGFTIGQAMVNGRDVRVACVGSVFTLPPYRNQGVATEMLRAAVAGARAAGADLGLVSGARGLYSSAGFDPFPPVRRYRLPPDSPTRPSVPPHLELEPYQADAGMLADLARLHEQEPVRFVRSTDDWRQLLAARVVYFEPGTVFLIRSHQGRVGYVAVGRPPVDDGGQPQARVVEIAGDRQAIASAAPLLREALEVDSLDFLMPAHDDSLEGPAKRLGWIQDEVRLPFSSTWWNPDCAGLPLPFYGLNYV